MRGPFSKGLAAVAEKRNSGGRCSKAVPGNRAPLFLYRSVDIDEIYQTGFYPKINTT
jgi:hypothetical protein